MCLSLLLDIILILSTAIKARELSFYSIFKNICLNGLNVGICFKNYFSAVKELSFPQSKNFSTVKYLKGALIDHPKVFLIKGSKGSLIKGFRKSSLIKDPKGASIKDPKGFLIKGPRKCWVVLVKVHDLCMSYIFFGCYKQTDRGIQPTSN